MIKKSIKVVCDYCGWVSHDLDVEDNYLFEAIEKEGYIRYGSYHFCCNDCKNNFLTSYELLNNKGGDK